MNVSGFSLYQIPVGTSGHSFGHTFLLSQTNWEFWMDPKSFCGVMSTWHYVMGKLIFNNFMGDFCPHTLFLHLPAGDNPGRMGGHHVLRDGCTLFLQFYIFYIAYHSKYDLGDSPFPCPWGVKSFPVYFPQGRARQDLGFRAFPPSCPPALGLFTWMCLFQKNPNFSSFNLLNLPGGASFLWR